MKVPTACSTTSLLLLLLSFAGTSNAVGPAFPDIIPLPTGFQPEGVALGFGHELFTGSLADGSIYSADLRTGEGQVVIPGQPDGQAVGLSFDRRSGLLFVAGGTTGAAYVYDPSTGSTVAVYQLADPGPGTFVNDVIVTRDAAYFTDSFQPVFYHLSLGPAGGLADPGAVEVIPLAGEFDFIAGEFNANGIESSANGAWLLIGNGTSGKLYRVAPETGEATEIDLGGDLVPRSDGLVLAGQTLYVVQNLLNQIAVIELAPDLTFGQIESFITSPYLRIPSTAAKFGSSLYAVNARFGTPDPSTADYEIVQLRIPFPQ